MHIEFEIPGPPIPKGRPRFDKTTRRAYTPEKTRMYERRVKFHGWAAVQALPPDDAKYWPVKSGQLQADLWIRLQRSKGRYPDADNIIKSVLDGLEGVLYRNDSQVLPSTKAYKIVDEKPGVRVRIQTIDQ